MSLKINQSSGEQYVQPDPLTPGTYPARIVHVIDIGLQYRTNWKTGNQLYRDDEGKETEEDTGNPIIQPKVWITFELPTELISVGDKEMPRWLSKAYVVSNHEKSALYKLITAAGNIKSLDQLVGRAVMVTTSLSSSGRDKIQDVMTLMKGVLVPELIGETKVYDLDNPDQSVYDSLNPFVKSMIDNRVNKQKGGGNKQKSGDKAPKPKQKEQMDDDIPF